MHFRLHGEHTAPWRIVQLFAFLVLVAVLHGCVGVKNPPRGKPYVFENNLELASSNVSKERATILKERLLEYVDDSLKVPTRGVIGFSQRIRPPVFDSAAVFRSIKFFKGYLNSEGFYHATLDSFRVEVKSRKRKKAFFSFQSIPVKEVYTTFFLQLGTSLRIDSVWYQFANAELQRIADSAANSGQLRKNVTYNKQAVAAELDRLAGIFRNHGYLKMTRNALLAEIDTVDESLISFDQDIIQQQLSALQRKQDPTAKIRVFERPGTDSSVFVPYEIDSVLIYPETRITDNPDSLIAFGHFEELTNKSGVTIRQKLGTFQEKMLRRANYMLPGRLYSDRNYFRTLNNYSQMGSWQQLDVRTATRITDSAGKIDMHLFLIPAKRKSFQVDAEGSQNNNISVGNALAGRFFAVGLSATYRNRNVMRSGTQSALSAKAGYEINNVRSTGNPGLFQSFIFTANQNFSIPRLLWPLQFLDKRNLDFRRTVLNLGGFYTDRYNFYRQTSLNVGIQWEWRRDKNSFTFSLPSFETVNTRTTDSLNKVIAENPALVYSFAPGSVLSMRGSWERVLKYKSPRHFGFIRTAAETTIPVNISLFGRQFFQFFRIESQFVHHIKLVRNSFDMRFYGGVGWDLSNNRVATMPFFRQFVTGGSNSMRAWGIRQLGLGNSLASDTSAFTDRFGDIQLELNLEYRMRIARLFGYNFDGALFADIGNIWNHTPAPDGLGDFQLKYLYRDLAIALGYGVRWDLSFLVIRFDAGFKVKDPVREGAGWLQTLEWRSTNRLGTNRRSNLAIQFGIGYPF